MTLHLFGVTKLYTVFSVCFSSTYFLEWRVILVIHSSWLGSCHWITEYIGGGSCNLTFLWSVSLDYLCTVTAISAKPKTSECSDAMVPETTFFSVALSNPDYVYTHFIIWAVHKEHQCSSIQTEKERTSTHHLHPSSQRLQMNASRNTTNASLSKLCYSPSFQQFTFP